VSGPAVAATALAGVILGLAAGPALAGLTLTAADDRQPLLGPSWWQGGGAGTGRRLAVTVLSAGVLTAVCAGIGPAPALPAFLVLAAAGVVLAVVDAEHFRLPDRLTRPTVLLTAGLLAAAAVPAGPGVLARAGAAGAVSAAALFAVALAWPEGLGLGDVKLAGLLGMHLGWLGWSTLLLGLSAGVAAGAATALGMLAAGRARRRTGIAYGPPLLAGALLAILSSGLGPTV